MTSRSCFCPTPDRRIQLVISSEFDKVEVHNMLWLTDSICMSTVRNLAQESDLVKRRIALREMLSSVVLYFRRCSELRLPPQGCVRYQELRCGCVLEESSLLYTLYTLTSTHKTDLQRESKSYQACSSVWFANHYIQSFCFGLRV